MTLLILLSQSLDAGTFILAVHAVGIGPESNPLAGALYASGGLALVVAVKMAGAIGLALLALHVPARWGYLAAGAGLFGAVTNLGGLL